MIDFGSGWICKSMPVYFVGLKVEVVDGILMFDVFYNVQGSSESWSFFDLCPRHKKQDVDKPTTIEMALFV